MAVGLDKRFDISVPGMGDQTLVSVSAQACLAFPQTLSDPT